MHKKRIVVEINGGIINRIISNFNDVEIEILTVDEDIDGLGEEDISRFNNTDVYMREELIEFAPDSVNEIYAFREEFLKKDPS